MVAQSAGMALRGGRAPMKTLEGESHEVRDTEKRRMRSRLERPRNGSISTNRLKLSRSCHVHLAIARSPMRSSARTSKGWVYERNAESTLCERRVCVPEVPAVVCARKVD